MILATGIGSLLEHVRFAYLMWGRVKLFISFPSLLILWSNDFLVFIIGVKAIETYRNANLIKIKSHAFVIRQDIDI